MGDSPAKKLDFQPANKENLAIQNDEVAVPIVGIPDLADDEEETESGAKTAETIKPEEADEPLLQENPQRFVLFPIKYHEVRRSRTRHGRVDA
jgi:ribonucleoside-diphosphate reductase subunit M2